LYFFFRIGFITGFFIHNKTETFLDLDTKYILPLKTRFLKTFENQTIEYNENIDDVLRDKITKIHTNHVNQKNKNRRSVVEKKPDILLFIADDMTSTACEPYGNKDVHTPYMAQLAKEGICFDNMNNATAMCGPTRQSLYTGIYPVKNGSYPNHAQVYDNRPGYYDSPDIMNLSSQKCRQLPCRTWISTGR
jgi:hypothetical protein